ncbi:MAG: CapA family protein [Lachnospiraceae bacterium]|nr:CapA family protein [Lachnospiraceae bacterium]
MKKAWIAFFCTLVLLIAVAAVFFIRETGREKPAEAVQQSAETEETQVVMQPADTQPEKETIPAKSQQPEPEEAAFPSPEKAESEEEFSASQETAQPEEAASASPEIAEPEEAVPSSAEITEPEEVNPETKPESAAPAGGKATRLVFTGDVELSESVQSKYDRDGIAGVVSDRIHGILRDADFTMINNEFCFSLRGEKNMEKQFTFRVNPSYVGLFTELGVDVAGLANNHVMDYGKTALLDTITTLTDAGIDYTGAGNTLEEASRLVVRTAADGRKVGFLAAGHVIPTADWNVTVSQPGEFCFYDETELLRVIGEAKNEVDLLFVMVHWGQERTITPTDYQVRDGQLFLDAGADAVIGMHSHCLQPVVFHQGKPVFYSLGNFIFNRSIRSGGGGCVEVTIPNGEPPRYRIIPTCAKDAWTDMDESGFSYVESISSGISVDSQGWIQDLENPG